MSTALALDTRLRLQVGDELAKERSSGLVEYFGPWARRCIVRTLAGLNPRLTWLRLMKLRRINAPASRRTVTATSPITSAPVRSPRAGARELTTAFAEDLIQVEIEGGQSGSQTAKHCRKHRRSNRKEKHLVLRETASMRGYRLVLPLRESSSTSERENTAAPPANASSRLSVSN